MQPNRFEKNRVKREKGCQLTLGGPRCQAGTCWPPRSHSQSLPSRWGQGALTAPRAPTRKTGVWEAPPPAEAPGAPATRAGKAPASPRSSAASLHTGALTHARAHSHTYTHNKRKTCEPRAEVRCAQEVPPPGPHRAARGLLTCWSSSVGARIPAARSSPALALRRPARGRCRRTRGGSGPTTRATPRRRPPSPAPAKSRSCGCRIRPGLPTSRVSSEIKLVCLIILGKIPHPYKPREI